MYHLVPFQINMPAEIRAAAKRFNEAQEYANEVPEAEVHAASVPAEDVIQQALQDVELDVRPGPR